MTEASVDFGTGVSNVERGGVKTALDCSKYDASDLLAKIVYYAIMLFVLSTAFGVFGTNPISSYLHAVIAYLPLLFAALVGIAIVAIGGGGIRTMSGRWEAVAARYDEGKPRIAAAARNAPSLRDQARQAAPDDATTGSSADATAYQLPASGDRYSRPSDQYDQYGNRYDQPGDRGDYPGSTSS